MDWIIDKHIESLQKTRKAGVKIAMGTGAGTPFNSHGKSPFELRLLVEAGLSPMEAIISATKTASEVMDMAKTHGTLSEGKRADSLTRSFNISFEPCRASVVSGKGHVVVKSCILSNLAINNHA